MRHAAADLGLSESQVTGAHEAVCGAADAARGTSAIESLCPVSGLLLADCIRGKERNGSGPFESRADDGGADGSRCAASSVCMVVDRDGGAQPRFAFYEQEAVGVEALLEVSSGSMDCWKHRLPAGSGFLGGQIERRRLIRQGRRSICHRRRLKATESEEKEQSQKSRCRRQHNSLKPADNESAELRCMNK